MTYYASTGEVFTLQSLIVPIGLFGAFLIAHVAIRFLAPAADSALLPIVYALCGIGLVFVMRFADPEAAQRQVLWLFLSVIGLIGVLAVVKSLDKLARYKYTLMILALVLLVLPAFIGKEEGGARLWISVGTLFSFQPGEFAKILIVLFLGGYLADNREMLSVSTRSFLGIKIPALKVLFPVLLMWALSLMVVVAEKDLGLALLLFGIFLVMIYVATGRMLYVVGGLILFAIGGTAAYFMFGHVQTRVAIWLDPFAYATNKGYQLVQSLYALADGGLTGTGIGNGLAARIPEVSNDMIFAAIGEEMGFLGAAAVILLFMLFAIRGFSTAARAKSDISAFAAVGLTAAISLQAFVIIGGVTRLIPLTGVTLPFMSRGGTSLFASFMVLALLLRAGDEGTGVETEMRVSGIDTGTLGRLALGKRLTRITAVFAVLFALLFVNLTYIQVVKANEYKARSDNTRALVNASKQERGSILTSDGVVLAESIKGSDGLYDRSYPQGSFASHTVGYVDPKYGMTGIELVENEILTGHQVYDNWNDVIDAALGRPVSGNNVVLTLDSKVQKAAEKSISDVKGAVIVLDPKTGAVLASASNPTYDANNLEEYFTSADAEGALIDRSRDALYPPGSTFKVVTLAEALREGIATLSTTFNATSPMTIGNAKVTNIKGASQKSMTLEDAFVKSYNTVFAQLAVEEGSKNLVKAADSYGFGNKLGLDLMARASLMPDPNEMTEWETAWAGAGQPVGEHESPAGPQATVTQMAVVAATVANKGVANEPHYVERITGASGNTITTTKATKIGTALPADVAAEVSDMMVEVVKRGTGQAAAVSGVTVAGKTGTAEVGKSAASHSWFIGFAPAENPTVAIAIIVENGEGGARLASARASSVLQAALKAAEK